MTARPMWVWNSAASQWELTGLVAKGDTGDAGPQGIQGVQGPQGAQGQAGNDGAPGAQGLQGPKGDKGDTGNPGAQGIQGPKGDAGVQGPAGADSTVPGPAGAKGDKGDPGADGASTWGDITGTLAAQVDLQTALDAALPKTGGTLVGALTITDGANQQLSFNPLGGDGTRGVLTLRNPYPDGNGVSANFYSHGGASQFQLDGSGNMVFRAYGSGGGNLFFDSWRSSGGAIYFRNNSGTPLTIYPEGTALFAGTVAVGAPTAAGHAATKSYVDGAIPTWTSLADKPAVIAAGADVAAARAAIGITVSATAPESPPVGHLWIDIS